MSNLQLQYWSKFAKDYVVFYGPHIAEMTKNEFIEQYVVLAAKVIDAEKKALIPTCLIPLISEGREFSISRGYSTSEIEDYQRLLYMMGRERPNQFKVNGTPYLFTNCPLLYYGNTNNGCGAPRPDPNWLWEQWLANPGPEAMIGPPGKKLA